MPTVDCNGNSLYAPLRCCDKVGVPGVVAVTTGIAESVPSGTPILQNVHTVMGVRQFLLYIEQHPVGRQHELAVVVAVASRELFIAKRPPVPCNGLFVVDVLREFQP